MRPQIFQALCCGQFHHNSDKNVNPAFSLRMEPRTEVRTFTFGRGGLSRCSQDPAMESEGKGLVLRIELKYLSVNNMCTHVHLAPMMR